LQWRPKTRKWRSPVPQSEEKLFPKCELPHTSRPLPERCCLRVGRSGAHLANAGGEATRVQGMEHDRSTILVVDDDPAILEYAGEVLEECGYAVLTALNAATALVMLRNSERIDLLFTDLVMPGSDGIELARQAGEEVSGLKVLFTTGYSTGAAPGGCLLKKPYRPHQLVGAVAAALTG
jgi:CheY-like chemotaxis protein